ncbi:hypothetical protein E0L93_01170 [Rubrobacter taiwanensis]|uniref:Uncharacterized protein n=1 Tax=Rubrobacter taiwanensis TaxID=185139 RepID=A0A4R1BRT4_9ACTN|nr:hypothetical protein [Rubrobacter taiwanensis]TCJ20464.1 hypothetical protein E0L93_01170 [Rubrobacter taiwanensis]
MIGPGLRAVVLASYSSRNRVLRDAGGRIHVSWGPVTVKMSQGEFVELAGVLSEAVGCPVRRGELARGSGGQVVKCAMGQVMVVHDDFTLWFGPEEFEAFCRLVCRALGQLEDIQPLPALGLPCSDCPLGFSEN